MRNFIANIFGFDSKINALEYLLKCAKIDAKTAEESADEYQAEYMQKVAENHNLKGQLRNAQQELENFAALYEALEIKLAKKDKAYKELSRKFSQLKPRLVKKYGGEK